MFYSFFLLSNGQKEFLHPPQIHMVFRIQTANHVQEMLIAKTKERCEIVRYFLNLT